MTLPRRVWGAIVWLFERADIIPPLIIVSSWHYGGALVGRDPLPVAVILGILVDLGHYRAVKSFLRHMDSARLAVMVVLTVMAGYYHWLWYRDLILAAAVPMLIICLALLSRWENWEKQAARTDAQTYAQAARSYAQTLAQDAQATQARAWSCALCGAEFAKQQGLAAHQRVHTDRKDKDNGNH